MGDRFVRIVEFHQPPKYCVGKGADQQVAPFAAVAAAVSDSRGARENVCC